MHHRLTLAAAAVTTLFVSTPAVLAQSDDVGIIVMANRIATRESETTYSAEVHTRKQIEQSGASNLFDYLGHHSSVRIAPNFGNRQTPQIDMRGYGLGDGYQNVVVTVDGVRQNNIDQSGSLIGSIPMADIERIEITKGSGSVLFGDGATAGTIQITTRRRSGGTVEAFAGSFGAFGTTASAGTQSGMLSLDGSVTRSNTDGYSKEDPTGHKDRSTVDQWRFDAALAPSDTVRVKAGAGRVDIDTRYTGALTLAQFESNPAQSNGSPYTHQRFRSDIWHVGADAWLTSDLKFIAEHRSEDKRSEFVGSPAADYDYQSNDLGLVWSRGDDTVMAGIQNFDGDRSSGTTTTSKNTLGAYLQGQVRLDAFKVTAGARRERVEYENRLSGSPAQAAAHRLTAADLGANYRMGERVTVFANVNRAYQAPDIDRFFLFGGGFNGFIEPMRVTTFNAGVHYASASHQARAVLFHARLKNEIYLDPFTFDNTNIDQSHKQGLELHDRWQVAKGLVVVADYTWTRAIIDSEERGAGAFNGKEMPGVSRHAASLGTELRANSRTTLGATFAWRGAAWALGDFDNNNSQRQRPYASFDVRANYKVKDDLEAFASVENLFARENGFWIADNAIYPVNFKRSFRAGIRASF